jgi:hypothetical protein
MFTYTISYVSKCITIAMDNQGLNVDDLFYHQISEKLK